MLPKPNIHNEQDRLARRSSDLLTPETRSSVLRYFTVGTVLENFPTVTTTFFLKFLVVVKTLARLPLKRSKFKKKLYVKLTLFFASNRESNFAIPQQDQKQ